MRKLRDAKVGREGRLPPLGHVAIVHAFTGAFLEADERTSLTRWRQSKTPMAGMDARLCHGDMGRRWVAGG